MKKESNELIFLGSLFILAGVFKMQILLKYLSLHVYRLSILLSIIIVIFISTGVGIILKKNWARIMASIVVCVQAIRNLYIAVVGLSNGGGTIENLAVNFAILTIFSLYAVTFYYLNRKTTRELFVIGEIP